MPKVVKRTFSLTEEQAKFIDEKVASGNYVSGSEVVREGLRGMQEDSAAIDRWLVDEVLPTLKKLDKDPGRARPAEEVFGELLEELRQESAPKKRKRA
ncbi:MAG TPA: type II toxin-antitoxin system ParD family antitoxin [Sphingomicrobium sp.]|jgi:putative addiction module CopG family antidote|nr:type II toxin-antitoxin system ParD family antitoxin [Sphingomicrobium sp.]